MSTICASHVLKGSIHTMPHSWVDATNVLRMEFAKVGVTLELNLDTGEALT
jgi:hypothetical protein